MIARNWSIVARWASANAALSCSITVGRAASSAWIPAVTAAGSAPGSCDTKTIESIGVTPPAANTAGDTTASAARNLLAAKIPVTVSCTARAGRPTVTVSPTFHPSAAARVSETNRPSSPVARLPDSTVIATTWLKTAVSTAATAPCCPFTVATVNGQQGAVAAVDTAVFSQVVAMTVESGSLATGDDGLLVSDTRAAAEGWKVGDTVTVGLPARAVQLTVTGIFAANRFLAADVVVSPAVLAAGGVTPIDSIVFVSQDPGADPAAVTAGIQAELAALPTVILQDKAAFADAQRATIDQFLAIIYALLALAVIIAVLGIVNTLGLSVIERTHEVGLLRAVGMSRRQLRSMIRLESVAISILGAVLGIGLGVVFGVSLRSAMAGQGITVLAIPWTQLVVFLLLAGVVGVLAAVFPARRAARMGVLRAITTT